MERPRFRKRQPIIINRNNIHYFAVRFVEYIVQGTRRLVQHSGIDETHAKRTDSAGSVTVPPCDKRRCWRMALQQLHHCIPIFYLLPGFLRHSVDVKITAFPKDETVAMQPIGNMFAGFQLGKRAFDAFMGSLIGERERMMLRLARKLRC